MVADKTNNDPKALEAAKLSLQHLARDHARYPMQWNSTNNGGFSSGKSWMRVNDDYHVCNAEQQVADKTSVLAFWKDMLLLRKQCADLFVHGDFDLLDESNEHTFCFTKEWKGQKALVTLNFSSEKRTVEVLDGFDSMKADLLAGTVDDCKGNTLEPYEGRVYLLS